MEEPIDYDDPVERVFRTVLSNQHGESIFPIVLVGGVANFVGLALLGPVGLLAGPIAGTAVNYFYEDKVLENIAKTKVGRRKFVYAMAKFMKVDIDQIHTVSSSTLYYAGKKVLEKMSDPEVRKKD